MPVRRLVLRGLDGTREISLSRSSRQACFSPMPARWARIMRSIIGAAGLLLGFVLGLDRRQRLGELGKRGEVAIPRLRHAGLLRLGKWLGFGVANRLPSASRLSTDGISTQNAVLSGIRRIRLTSIPYASSASTQSSSAPMRFGVHFLRHGSGVRLLAGAGLANAPGARHTPIDSGPHRAVLTGGLPALFEHVRRLGSLDRHRRYILPGARSPYRPCHWSLARSESGRSTVQGTRRAPFARARA
jgi:hypothetical protein